MTQDQHSSRSDEYRKKPVVIEAFQWDQHAKVTDAPLWFYEGCTAGVLNPEFDGTLTIKTLEDGKDGRAKHVAEVGDWIIKGVKGELYPCKPDIFAATYEPANAIRSERGTSRDDVLEEAATACERAILTVNMPQGGTERELQEMGRRLPKFYAQVIRDMKRPDERSES